MAIYSMVKTTTFNGLRLPSIVRWNPGNRRDAPCPGIRLRRLQDAVVLMSKEKLSYAQQVCVKSAERPCSAPGWSAPAKVGSPFRAAWTLGAAEVLRRRQRIVPFRFDIMAIHLESRRFDAETTRRSSSIWRNTALRATLKSRITARAVTLAGKPPTCLFLLCHAATAVRGMPAV